jgi:hypothetical protein
MVSLQDSLSSTATTFGSGGNRIGKGSYNGGSSIVNARGFGSADPADPKKSRTKLAKASLTDEQRKAMKKNGKKFLSSSRILIRKSKQDP